MKKTRFFSRICAAFLAVATAVMPLATTGVAAGPTYTVKIISPDVPNDGTYTYKFYQIIGGTVERNEDTTDTSHPFVISKPEWGDALGGADFGKVEDYTLVQEDTTNSINQVNITKAEALITAISETDANDSTTSGSDVNVVARGRASTALGIHFRSLVTNYLPNNASYKNGFEDQFVHNIVKASPRTVMGFTEVLNKVNDSQTLKAFAELIFNGISAGSYDWDTSKDKVDLPEIKFLADSYNPKTASINSSNTSGEYTVNLDAPGYYLVACVKDDGKLTNNGSTTKPKPVSAMLLLVGEGENEIVGKNTTAVATVDFKMFHETVEDVVTTKDTSDTSKPDCTYNFSLPAGAQDLGYFDDSTKDYDAASKWVDRASFGNLQIHIDSDSNTPSVKNYYDEYVLCRLDITLPENFESYKNVGYFLAVAGDWARSSADGKIVREGCRPLVYVKHKGESNATKVIELSNNNTLAGSPVVVDATSSINNFYDPLYYYGNCKVNDNKTATEYFYLGDLFNTRLYSEDTFKGGDHIYIYFPAYYTANNAAGISGSDRMILSSSAWAIYSNNPYSFSKITNEEIPYNSDVSIMHYDISAHVASGDVGMSKTSSVNVNNYSVNVRVTGKTDDGSQKFDRSNAKYALYRMNGTTKEYALIYYGASDNSSIGYSSRVCGWYSKDAFMELKPDTESWFDENGNLTSVGTLGGDYVAYFILLSDKIGGNEEYGRIVHGLAPGTYYIEELTIGADNAANIHTYHYQKATQPFKVTIGQEYNKDYGVFSTDTKSELIDELSVAFAQADPADRTIETEIITPAPGDGDKHNVTKTLTKTTVDGITTVDPATADGIVEVRITHNSLHLIWLPETGGIGTTIFFIVGGAIVVAATVLIVTRFRVKRERL